MQRSTIVILASLATLAAAAPAAAQTCTGNQTFEQARTRFIGQAAFSSDLHAFSAAVGRGFNQFFAGGGLTANGVSNVDGTNKGFVFQAGTERKVGADSKYSVCPLAGLSRTSWSDDDFSGSDLAFDFGASVGFLASTTGTTAIVPNFGMFVTSVRSSFEDFGSVSETFLRLQAGVGLVLSEKVAIVPSIVIPFKEEASPVIQVTATIKIGQ